MGYSQALIEMIKIIQTGDSYIEEYEAMLCRFLESQESGDTIRMSFELAKQPLLDQLT